MDRPRIVLADDYEQYREFCCKLLHPHVEIVAAVSNGQAAIEAAKAHVPDLVVLDIEMGTTNGFAVARWIKEHMPAIKILFLSMHDEPDYLSEAAAIGAHGYVMKRNAVTELLPAVQDLLGGRTHF